MPAHINTAIAALITTVALALAVAATTANARSISLSEKEFAILFRALEFNAAGNRIACPMTVAGHFFERTVVKIANNQIGVITRVEPTNDPMPPCTGGTITILNETLPWRFNFVGFSGTLPRIEALRDSLIGVAFRVATGSIGCLAGTTARNPVFVENIIDRSTGGVTGFRVDETMGIPLGGGFLCELAGESRFSGTGTVLNLAQNASVTVTLI